MDNDTNEEKLDAAKELVQQGKKKEGGEILVEIVKSEPKNEIAWIWLSKCIDDKKKKIQCVQKAIALNPNNHKNWIILSELSENEAEKIEYIKKVRDIVLSSSEQETVISTKQYSSQVKDKSLNLKEIRVDQKKYVLCKNCGLKISENHKFCGNCGKSIDSKTNQSIKTIDNSNIDGLLIGLVFLNFLIRYFPIWPDMKIILATKILIDNSWGSKIGQFQISEALNTILIFLIILLGLTSIFLSIFKKKTIPYWIWAILFLLYSLHHIWTVIILSDYSRLFSFTSGPVLSLIFSLIIILRAVSKLRVGDS